MKTIVDYASKVKEQHALNKTLAPVETDLTDASRAYAIGEQFIYDGDLFKAKTAIAQHDALVLNTNYEAADDITTQIKNKTVTTDPVPTEGSTNPVQSNGVFVEDRNIYKVMGKNGAKNLSKPINSTTYNGITVVCDSDGVLTVTGTASASGGRLNITGDTFTLKAGTYKVVQNSDDLTKYASIVCHRKSDNTSLGYVLIENGTINNTNAQFTLAADTECFLGMNTYQGTDYGTGAGTKEYAMVVLADDTDTTYQPYAKTNQQLTAENEALTNQIKDMNNVYGSKNLLPNQASDDTWNGITWKVNSDGTLSASGTATANSIRTIVEAFEIPVGKYILNGCPSGSGYSTYYLNFSVESGTVTPNGGNDIGEGLAFEVTQTAKITVKARVISGQTVNIAFEPMIRLASITDDTYEPYAKTNQQLTAENQTLTNQVTDISDEIADMNNILGAKNLLPFPYVHQARTESGITWTPNSNGTITVNGTATADSYFKFRYDEAAPYLEKGKSYTVSISDENVHVLLIVAYLDSSNVEHTLAGGINTKQNITIPNDFVKLRLVGKVYSGQTISNVVVYPMIRLASIHDDTYEPYAMTNREVTPYVQAISNPNLLDNPWFTVNQRGFASTSSAVGYTVDRWRVAYNPASNTCELTSNGMVLNSVSQILIFQQRFDEEQFKSVVGKMTTFSVLLSDGTMHKGSAIFPQKGDASNTVVINNDDLHVYYQYNSNSDNLPSVGIYPKVGKTVTIRAIKLELGSVSTLAQDTAPNYATELLKCQRYFQRIACPSTYALSIGQASSADYIRFPLTLACVMRGVPTLTVSDLTKVKITQSLGASAVSILALNLRNASDKNLYINLEAQGSSLTVGAMWQLILTDSSVHLDLSADL